MKSRCWLSRRRVCVSVHEFDSGVPEMHYLGISVEQSALVYVCVCVCVCMCLWTYAHITAIVAESPLPCTHTHAHTASTTLSEEVGRIAEEDGVRVDVGRRRRERESEKVSPSIGASKSNPREAALLVPADHWRPSACRPSTRNRGEHLG